MRDALFWEKNGYCCNLALQLFLMRGCLYIIAVLLVIGWILGITMWNAPHLIYVLLVLAAISVLLGIIKGK